MSRSPLLASLRPFALVWLSLAVLPLAVMTATVTRLHKKHLAALASDWSRRGDVAYRSGRPGEAIADFRSALIYAREDPELRLRLSRALIAAGRGAEARGYLLTLWENEPGNGPVNLELGRLMARSGDAALATRYYHAAIEGAWENKAEQRRRESRVELADYLVAVGERARARPELIALSADMPESLSDQKAIAALFARAGLTAAAQSAYEHVLDEAPTDVEALVGAGEVAFQSADYTRAARYLPRAVARGASSPDVIRDAALARLVLDIDPWQRRISVAARSARAARAFAAASARLNMCLMLHPDSADMTRLSAEAAPLSSRASARSLARNPDDVDAVMDVVFGIEIATADACGEPDGIDRALYQMAVSRKTER